MAYAYQRSTFESLDAQSSYLHIPCISRQYGSSSFMKIIGLRSRSQDRKKSTTGTGTDATDGCVYPPPLTLKIPQFRQRKRDAARFHQFRKTSFSFTTGSRRFTETDLKAVSVSTDESRPYRA